MASIKEQEQRHQDSQQTKISPSSSICLCHAELIVERMDEILKDVLALHISSNPNRCCSQETAESGHQEGQRPHCLCSSFSSSHERHLDRCVEEEEHCAEQTGSGGEPQGRLKELEGFVRSLADLAQAHVVGVPAMRRQRKSSTRWECLQ